MIGTHTGSHGWGTGKGAGWTGEVGAGGRAATLEEAAALDDATAVDEATPTDEATTVDEALGVEVGAAHRGAASLIFPTAQVEASSVYSSK
jgi:hypothetical protein